MSKFSPRSFHFPGDGGEILWGEKILKVEKNHKKFPWGGGLLRWSNLNSRKKSQTNAPLPPGKISGQHWRYIFYHIFSPSSFSTQPSPLRRLTSKTGWAPNFLLLTKNGLERCFLINWCFWKINSQIYRTNQVGNFESVSYIASTPGAHRHWLQNYNCSGVCLHCDRYCHPLQVLLV